MLEWGRAAGPSICLKFIVARWRRELFGRKMLGTARYRREVCMENPSQVAMGGRRARRMRAMDDPSNPYMTSDGTEVDAVSSMPTHVYHPLFDESLNYSVMQVPDDPDAQVSATIDLMRQYVREDAANSPEIRREAQEIYRQCLGDGAMAVRSIWWKVQHKIQFLRDESTAQPLESFLNRAYGSTPIVEILIRPRDMADLKHRRVGDCDDYSMYCAALLMALGIDCSFVTIAGNAKDPDHFTHVYVAAYPHGFSGERIAVDASHGKYCGWEGKSPGMRCVEWKVSDGVGEPVDSIVSGVLGTVLFVGAAAGFVYWMLK